MRDVPNPSQASRSDPECATAHSAAVHTIGKTMSMPTPSRAPIAPATASATAVTKPNARSTARDAGTASGDQAANAPGSQDNTSACEATPSQKP